MTSHSTRRAAIANGRDYLPVTPHDTQPLPELGQSLYVEQAGTIAFISARGLQRTVAVPDHGWVLCGVTHVLQTGTTATGIHAIVAG